MARISGICSVCGALAKPVYTCRLCGTLCCKRCFAAEKGICKNCESRFRPSSRI